MRKLTESARRSRSPSGGAGRFVALTCGLLVAACGGGESGGEEAGGEAPAQPQGIRVEGVGLETPESVLHDPEADVYLVSNINGEPLGEDDNGFISRVSPDGSVDSLKWIDGAAGDFELNAPKGMKLSGDSLYVADIDCVRVFVRSTGAHAQDICFEDATFLNDITVDQNGVLYVTDMGTGEDAPGAVYRFDEEGNRARLIEGAQLGGANGIEFTPRGLLVVSARSGEIYRVAADGMKTPVASREGWRLDGIVFRDDESFFFTNWADSSVYMVDTDGSVSQPVQGVNSPGDLGYDAQRHRLLVPMLQENAIVISDVEAPEATSQPQPPSGGSDAPGGAQGR